ncbi:hypothetical protein UO65_0498 [Actinokineospora spheciospongiae]|uniref:Uncharacterized protein n=1 Tax=Actinokineospora spheciospongiae TaxID=909613 RepID=W7J561_9PSEU|nr:hypothetical protein UO65_0498 [Actinokineospora spheciospongiae]
MLPDREVELVHERTGVHRNTLLRIDGRESTVVSIEVPHRVNTGTSKSNKRRGEVPVETC